MTKSFKWSAIYLASLTALVVARLIFGFINLSDNLSGWLFSTVMQCGFMGLMPFVMYAAIKPEPTVKFSRAVGLGMPDIVVILLSVVAGALMFLVNIVVSSLSNAVWTAVGYTSVNSSGVIYSGVEVFVLEAVTGSLMPAVFEEITHRGVLREALDEMGVGSFGKVMIMALFFGLGHQNITQFIPTFVVGIVISALAVGTGSLIPGMIIHFRNNFLITLTNFSLQWGLPFQYVYALLTNLMFTSNLTLALSLVGGLAVIGALVYEINRIERYRKRARERRESGYPCNYDVCANGEGAKRADLGSVLMLVIGLLVTAGGTVFTLIWGLAR